MIGDGGSMEILTIIPSVNEIISITDENPFQNIYNAFWNYFVKTWVMDYDPKIWNINGFTRDTERLINRTNNPVERYHRHLNEILPAHPSVPILVETLQKEGRKYVEYLSDRQ